MAALLLDKDGGLLVNKEWYHLNTSTNQAVFLRSTVPGVILGGELFTAHGPTYPYLTGCEGNTGTGATGVVTLGNNALAYNINGSHIVSCGGWAGPGTWPDDVAFVSALSNNGNRLAAIHRDGTNGSYIGTSSFRADATLLWPDTNNLYLQSRSDTNGNFIDFVAGSCDATTHLPQAVDNRLFYYNGGPITDRLVGYSYGVLTGTALFRVQILGSYYQIAIASVADPWGTPSIRNSSNAYSFGYNTETVSYYGAVHCPDAYSSYQGLWITALNSSSLGNQIVVIDDYFVTDIASWQYKVGASAVPWRIYPDPASDNHVLFSYSAGQDSYVMRLRASSVVAGLGFTTAGITTSAPTNSVQRYLGVAHNSSTPTGQYSGPITVSHVTSGVGGIGMSAPSNLVYQGSKD